MKILIEPVNSDTLAFLDTALNQLSTGMGDTHRAGAATLQTALFGEYPVCHAMIARHADGATPLGAALFSPVFSTVRGCAGVYVSDLWVSPEMRGQALGKQLLAKVIKYAEDLWQAGYIRLAAYNDNAPALAFYEKLGFETVTGETGLALSGAPLRKLMGM
ncbi:Mycothiol acetyltransferase [Roseovarius litorisediminis]|uniref:Mycothiol acetyltransferase n=1 Tax=Roseovarius litorisediminis TaxID=1312363 RepID=A0A1Y5TKW6_9RHOB|nr:N-acetyltransferase [Roseovarius litorisediminis]SLN66576.1 Mycothiol acetyltransferase [Roseovarius litorisediminis]